MFPCQRNVPLASYLFLLKVEIVGIKYVLYGKIWDLFSKECQVDDNL